MTSNKKLEKQINEIKQRNRKVEADKDWELSYTRRFLIAVFTYLAIALYLRAINITRPWLNAIVPTFAFLLSSDVLPPFKKIWMKYRKK